MPNIVIAGAGPIGLYTAILLRARYPGIKVTLLDGRIGNFNRPGVIAIGALEAINASFRHLGTPPLEVTECGSNPPAIHIRDLQNALYERAKSAGVTFISKDYSAVENRKIQIEDSDEEESLPCDLLIDCTGNDRVVTEEILGAEDISDNPIKNHFIAYIYVDDTNDKLMSPTTPVTPGSLINFRENTGWSEFVTPEIDNPPRRWRGPMMHKGTEYAAKYCLYFEIPSDLKKGNYSAYLRELLKLKYGKDIDFTPSGDLGAFNKFEVSPKALKRFVGEIDSIPVIALGDALISPEYRYGTGIENGVAGAYMLTASLSLDGTKITVNEDAWRKRPINISFYRGRNIDAVIGAHKERIDHDYVLKRRTLLQERDAAYTAFKEGPSEASNFDRILFAKLSKENGEACKERGDAYCNNSKWNESKALYLEAIDLYEFSAANLSDALSIEARDKQIKTLSNLGKAYLKNGDLDEAINCFERGIYLASNCEIIGMLSLEKLPKFLCTAADVKLSFFGVNHKEKRDFLERLIECLARTEKDVTPYVELLEKTKIIIENIKRTREIKSDVEEARSDASIEAENHSISEDTLSSKKGSDI